jgi:predicted ATPase
VEALTQYGAVALFVQRAQAVQPDFQVTDQNAAAVATICVRLDGLPLALELAASWVRLLTPAALLTRLSRRLTLLTGGARDLPARQQTLRATLDWSYSLLTAAEQRLFARLGVFVGGCTLEAAEAVCNAAGEGPLDVLEGIEALLDKSLLHRAEGPGDEPRVGMLETIREYAWERLAQRGEAETVQCAHAAYYLALAEEAAPQPFGATEMAWLDRLEREHDNLRAALAWYAQRCAETGLRLAGHLAHFWALRGYVTEGRQRLEGLLAAAPRGAAGGSAGAPGRQGHGTPWCRRPGHRAGDVRGGTNTVRGRREPVSHARGQARRRNRTLPSGIPGADRG